MAEPLEAYALLGDLHSAALVSLAGSIDWLTFPRFDSASCCSALLGSAADGRWSITPTAPFTTERSYREDTLVLETVFHTAEGDARVVDCMVVGGGHRLVRLVEGVTGVVEFDCTFAPKFDYGALAPWFSVSEHHALAIGGPDGLVLRTTAKLTDAESHVRSLIRVAPTERVAFELAYFPSHELVPDAIDVADAINEVSTWWSQWASRCAYRGPYREAVVRSLIVLKALTYAPTGAIVAAPTTSVPERIGGVRNWDYRFCWLRDATFTLLALNNAGYLEEAATFTEWLLRAIAGDPSKVQIMYGVAGERRLEEYVVPWLEGYEGSKPVRIGNAAFSQFQLDVYGEVIDALWQSVRAGMPPHQMFWTMLRNIIDYVGRHWEQPADHGMWEIRGDPQHFTQSKAMAWVTYDRAVKAIEAGSFQGPLEEWRALRDRVHAEIIQRSFDPQRNAFMQHYGSKEVDAGLLLLTQVGFLPPDDPRIRGTIAAIEADLYRRPFVSRYATETSGNVDGLPGEEGAFLACSFWLADNFVLTGRMAEAQALFEDLLALRNDVGLLSEEYDIKNRRLLGNFPQAFSHLALVNTAYNLSRYVESPAVQRANPAASPGDLSATA